MDLFGQKHKAGGRAAKPGTAAASRRNASRKKQDADKVEKFRARNLPRKRKPAGSRALGIPILVVLLAEVLVLLAARLRSLSSE